MPLSLYETLHYLLLEKYGHIHKPKIKKGIKMVDECVFDQAICHIQIGTFGDADIWGRVQKSLFCVEVTLHPNHMYLDWIVVPQWAQRKGIATEIMEVLAAWVKEQHKESKHYRLEIHTSDISPDHDKKQGITTFLIEKNGLKLFDENIHVHEEDLDEIV